MFVQRRYRTLLANITNTDGAAIAFSGGVDSAFLLHAAKEALGDNVIAVTVTTPYTARWEEKEARAMTQEAGIRHVVVDMPFPEEIRMNPPEHCYICKKALFTRLWEVTRELGYAHLFDGTNIDDLTDYRPGLKALRELGVESPLVQAGLTKSDIRHLSRELGLSTWNKPSFACLLSRLPIGTEVKEEELRRIEDAEVFLMKNGFPTVRVRCHGEIARIEVPQKQVARIVNSNTSLDIDGRLKKMGFKYVAVDLKGYTMGNLNQPAT